MTADELTELIEDAGYETRRYSGRFMYGDECPALTVETCEVLGVVAEIVNYAGMATGDVDEITRVLRQSAADQMGRDSTIVYFPKIKF